MKHETVRALVIASNRDAQPDCVNCTYQPYCGVQPEHNHRTQGQHLRPDAREHAVRVHKGIQDYLFEKLREDDPTTVEILRRWTTVRERTHFLQASAAS